MWKSRTDEQSWSKLGREPRSGWPRLAGFFFSNLSEFIYPCVLCWELTRLTGVGGASDVQGVHAMPSSEYFSRQADICLRLSLIASDDEVASQLIAMAQAYRAKAAAVERTPASPPQGALSISNARTVSPLPKG